jgi:predicted aspartyl protease
MRWKSLVPCLPLAAVAAVALAGAPAFAQDAKKCRLEKLVEWQVRSIGRHMVVDGAVNGKKIGIVLDTGAERSVLMRAAAKRLDVPVHEVRGARTRGVGGDSRVDVAVVDEFKLGEAAVGGMRFYVVGERDFGEGLDLWLGEDFLRNFDIEFDLADNAVRLWQPKECGDASLAYWTRDVVGEVAMEEARHIRLTVKLNGKPVAAILDSGASTSMVSDKVAAAVGGARGPATASAMGVGAKSIATSVARFASFQIGNEEIPDVAITAAQQDMPMLIGADFLRSHRVLVSHSQKKIYYKYVGGPVFVTFLPSRRAAPADTAKPKGD